MRTDYELLAERYDEDRARFRVDRDALIAELLTVLPLVQVLDVGCGTGTWLAAQRSEFATKPVVWTGADPSTAMLARASSKGVTNTALARAEELPFASGTFDYVVANFCFHHFDPKDSALDEIHRVLTDTGVFCINNIEPAAAEGHWLYEFFPETLEIDTVRFWPSARIGEALHARGFNVEIVVQSDPAPIAASEALADAERRIISQLAVLDNSAYLAGLARLREVASDGDVTLRTTRSQLRLVARSGG